MWDKLISIPEGLQSIVTLDDKIEETLQEEAEAKILFQVFF